MKIYIISDTHWNHCGIVEGGHRPAEHGEQTVKALAERLKPDDTLIHLGDVIFAQSCELQVILAQFAGTKILVRGNHDKQSIGWYQRAGFSMVVDSMSLKYGGEDILFTHIPVPVAELGSHTVNVHGHLHTNTHRVTDVEDRPACWDNGGKHRLFTLENLYQPVELGKFLRTTKLNPES